MGRFFSQSLRGFYRTLFALRDGLRALEAGVVGLFLIQSVRALYATLYARASSADLARRADPNVLVGQPGVVEAATVQREIAVVGVLLLLPLLAVFISRWRISFPLAVILAALGRSVALQTPDLEVPAMGLAVGAGLLYMAITVHRRPATFPAIFLVGFTFEQLIRAYGHTMDHTWESGYEVLLFNRGVEMGLLVALASIGVILLSVLVWFIEYDESHRAGYTPLPRGSLNLWGGLALGGVMFLEFTVLALPNAVARWANTDYTGIVPLLIAATALPLVPEVRDLARRFAGMFDGAWRGWLWVLLLGLLLVVGRRYHGILAGLALVVAQFVVGLTLWWLYHTEDLAARRRPARSAEGEEARRRFRVVRGMRRIVTRPFRGHNLSAVAVLVGVVTFMLLGVGDYFTYDYAYVRDLAAPYQNVGDVLRSFRNMGLGLALIAALLASIPMILARRRIPWRGGRTVATLLTLALVLAASFAGVTAASNSPVRRPISPDCLRVVTFNIHGGYSPFFEPNLEQVADLIELNGADVVLLQEVETGRMASAGVDQALWLARRLDMEQTFFPQNEALQGLAVLSRVPVVESEGALLVSEGNQAGVLHVMLDPDTVANDPQAAELGPLHVYNTWLGFRIAERDGQPVPEGEQDQNRQLAALLGWIRARPNARQTDRVILGGTFNFGPDSPLYNQPQNVGFIDPIAGLRSEEAMTVYLVNGTAARYDYLWTGNLPLSGAMVDQSPEATRTSDHRSAIISVSRHNGVQCPS